MLTYVLYFLVFLLSKSFINLALQSFSCVDQSFKIVINTVEKTSSSNVIEQKLNINDAYILYFFSNKHLCIME